MCCGPGMLCCTNTGEYFLRHYCVIVLVLFTTFWYWRYISNIQYFLFIWQSEIIILKLFILDLKLRVLNTTHHKFQHILLFYQAQFQSASSVQVQLRTEISFIITVRSIHPTHPDKYISSLKLNMYSRWMAIGCFGAVGSYLEWLGIARGAFGWP